MLQEKYLYIITLNLSGIMGADNCCVNPNTKKIGLNKYHVQSSPSVNQYTIHKMQVMKQQKLVQKQREQNNYHFSSLQNDPYSLVMLKNPKHVAKSIISTQYIVWIDSNMNNVKAELRNIENKVQNAEFLCFSNVKAATQQIITNLISRNLTVIVSLSLARQVQEDLVNLINIKNAICYCMNIQLYHQLKQKGQLGKKFEFGTNDQKELVKFLNKISNSFRQCKKLPNFVSLKDDGWGSNIQLKSLMAMLNRKYNRRKIIQNFCRLSELLYPNQINKIEDFKTEAISKQLSLERALYWYTNESPIYKVLNNLLRSSKNPTEIFYSQPYFTDVFKAIKNLYQTQTKEHNIKQLYCFRGGQLSEEEIKYFQKNIEHLVQNLGFFSTSKCKQTAQIFAKNVIFEVQILKTMKKDTNQLYFDFGYAQISQYSTFGQNEQEVIFNPLNTFKIMKVQKKMMKNKQIHIVSLRYGTLAQINDKNNKKQTLTQLQNFYLSQQIFKNKQMNEIKCQGDVFVRGACDRIDGGIQFWEKFLEGALNQSDQVEGLFNLATNHKSRGNFKESLPILMKCRDLCQKNNLNRYPKIINQIGLVQYQTGNFQSALKSFMEVKELNYNIFGFDQNFPTILNNLGLAQMQLNMLNQALQNFQQSLRLREVFFGTDSLQYSQSLGNIGLVQRKLGNYQEAMRNYKEKGKIIGMLLGNTNPLFAKNLRNIAVLYTYEKKHKEAIEVFKQSLQINRKTLGKKSRQYIEIIKDLATTYKLVKNSQSALELYQQLKNILQQVKRTETKEYQQVCRSITGLKNTLKY